MDTKNIINRISFSGFLFLFSFSVKGQYIGNHMLSASLNGGFLQKERCVSYQYSFARFTHFENENRTNQLFAGIEVGTTKLKEGTNDFSPFFVNSFSMKAEGNHFSFLLTNLVTKSKSNNKKGFKYNYYSLKFTHQRFALVSAYEWDTYNEDDDLDSDDPDVTITEEKCNAFDLELHLGKHIKLNSHNFLKFELYGGIRFGNVTGNRNWEWFNHGKGVQVYEKHYFVRELNPLILGVSLGYQINFGIKKLK